MRNIAVLIALYFFCCAVPIFAFEKDDYLVITFNNGDTREVDGKSLAKLVIQENASTSEISGSEISKIILKYRGWDKTSDVYQPLEENSPFEKILVNNMTNLLTYYLKEDQSKSVEAKATKASASSEVYEFQFKVDNNSIEKGTFIKSSDKPEEIKLYIGPVRKFTFKKKN